MATLIANINLTTVSSVTVSFKPSFEWINSQMMEMTSELSALLADYDNKMVTLEYKVFNSIDEIKQKMESAKKYNKPFKLNCLKGQLSVTNESRSTDIDDWFETSVLLKEFEFSRKGNKKSVFPTDSFDLYKYLENKDGKVLFLKITQI